MLVNVFPRPLFKGVINIYFIYITLITPCCYSLYKRIFRPAWQKILAAEDKIWRLFNWEKPLQIRTPN
jgi:hypothetical protein